MPLQKNKNKMNSTLRLLFQKISLVFQKKVTLKDDKWALYVTTLIIEVIKNRPICISRFIFVLLLLEKDTSHFWYGLL
jgi:hypothetical protein